MTAAIAASSLTGGRLRRNVVVTSELARRARADLDGGLVQVRLVFGVRDEQAVEGGELGERGVQAGAVEVTELVDAARHEEALETDDAGSGERPGFRGSRGRRRPSSRRRPRACPRPRPAWRRAPRASW
jgi:ABC-type phosphonate transport system ATPase subunit